MLERKKALPGPRTQSLQACAWITAALLGLAVCAPLPASAEEPARWEIDHSASRLGFEAKQSGARFEGDFRTWQADIRFDPKHLAESTALVTIDMGSATTFAPERDGLLVAPEWFDATTHPTATWRSASFRKIGTDTYAATGTLEMKGLTKPANLEFNLEIKGDTASVTGQAKLDRRDWSVGNGSWSTDKIVGFEVTVLMKLEAERLSFPGEAQ